MKRFVIILFVILAVGTVLGGNLVIKGSNTVYPAVQVWAEEFKARNPQVEISIEGAGSSTGIAALFNRQADIAMSSRWLKESEIEQMNAQGRYFIPFVVGYDGIAIVVNKSLDIDNISLEQLRDIYSGKITTWNQVDSDLPNRRIAMFSRDNASGTFEVFVDIVMQGGRLAPQVQQLASTTAEVEQVRQNPSGIGYIGMGYITEDIKAISVEGVKPTTENVNSGLYPISRPLYIFVDATDGFPKGVVDQFIRLALSPQGQSMLLTIGYVNAYGMN